MKSQTWKVSSMSRCTSEENKNCSLRGFTLTEFGETKNQSKYDRVNNVPTMALDADVKLEENNSLEQGAAIVCHNVTKWYNNREPVLSDLNMKVRSGSVYALLGSSGCGKTTLLSCVIGMTTLNKGSIFVYGENPGTNNVGIPGRNVGFMPQQISLYPEFTIWETFNYFAGFGGLTKDQCFEKAEFFTVLLKLPPLSRKIGTLSGGQQRRVSFAASLIHDPPLVILDEPTVGIDPIMRQIIWKFIEELASVKMTTVIITTHYIEEQGGLTCNATNFPLQVGIMRQGRIMVEQSPQQLIENSNSSSLDKAVLQLFKSGLKLPDPCKVDSSGNNRNVCSQLEAQLPCCPTLNPEIRGYRLATVKNTTAGQLHQTPTRIKTLVYKNFIVMIRNILLLSFVVWIPAAEMYTSNIAFEFNPKNLKVGIINLETNLTVCNSIIPNNQNCSLQNLSCEYLAAVDPDIVEFVNFDSAEDAEAAVHSGWLRGYLVFPQELSQNLYTFAIHGASTSDSVYNSTIVIARFDETNKAASISIKWELFNALDKFLSNVLMSCGLDPRTGISPLQYGQPIYGKPYANLDMREFTLPGVAIIVTFFFPIIVMGTRFIEERNCGMLVRSFVQGAQPWEIFVAYLLSEFWVLMAQAILVLIVAVPIGGLEFAGSIWLALALLLLNGYCGSAFGILLGSVSHEKLEVGVLTIGIFFPNIFLSGIGWPVEGMPEMLQPIVNILPCTLPAESLRSIVARGLEFSDYRVWPGFVVLFVHMLFYSGLIMLIQRRKYTK